MPYFKTLNEGLRKSEFISEHQWYLFYSLLDTIVIHTEIQRQGYKIRNVYSRKHIGKLTPLKVY